MAGKYLVLYNNVFFIKPTIKWITLGNQFELFFLLQTRELLILTNMMMLISDLSSEFLYHVQI